MHYVILNWILEQKKDAHLPDVCPTSPPPWPPQSSLTNAVLPVHSALYFPGTQRAPHKSNTAKIPFLYWSISFCVNMELLRLLFLNFPLII